MKKQIIKIISVIIITAICVIPNSVQAVNNTTNTTNSSNKTTETSTTSNSITSTSVLGTSNANLSNLGTKKYDFTGFKPDETSYDVTIPEEVTEVEVYAKTQDSKATYKVTGDKNLLIGDNKVTITVTAPDGTTTKNYYINVRRLGDPSKNPVETTEKEKHEEQTIVDQTQANTTIYSEPHTQTGWYIIGISLAIVTVALIVFIIIDDYKPEKKAKKSRKQEYYEEDEQQENFGEIQEQPRGINKSDYDPQATKVLNLDEIKRMRSKPNTKGKHF